MNDKEKRGVVLKGIDMPFWDLVRFLLKFSFASIPATIIFTIVVGGILSIFSFFFGYFYYLWIK